MIRSSSHQTRTRQEFLAKVRELVGVPYHHAGRSRQGLDCCGLLVVAAKELGLSYVDAPASYPRVSDGSMLGILEQSLFRVDLRDRLPGDVCVYWWNRQTKAPQHVGVYTECGGIIHTFTHTKAVVESSSSALYDRRLICVMRHPEII